MPDPPNLPPLPPRKKLQPGAPTVYPYRLAWTLWSYEVFVLLVILGFAIANRLADGKILITGLLGPVIALGMFFIENFLYSGETHYTNSLY